MRINETYFLGLRGDYETREDRLIPAAFVVWR